MQLDTGKLIHQKDYVTHTLATFMNGLKIAMFECIVNVTYCSTIMYISVLIMA